jgi:SAM-dependent methyltransferase
MKTADIALPKKSKGLTAKLNGSVRVPAVRCKICGGKTYPGLDLGAQPVGDLILSRADLRKPETFYPMQLFHCVDCGLTQLGYIVNPAIVYKNFPFVSGTTQTATQHLQTIPAQLVEMGGLGPQSFAVDIGSNDGTLLKAYRPFGVKILGVDPSAIPVQMANEAGIPTLHAFFNEETAQLLVKEHGHADAISAAGVFAHIAALDSVMRGIQTLLKPTGIFVSENQYWLDMVLTGHYDNMFHQHLRYYALRPLARLFARFNLEIFDVRRSEVHGGSFRVFACFTGAHPIHPRVAEVMAAEAEAKLYDPATTLGWARTIEERRRELQDKVWGLVKAGKKVIGIGAPAKASTVCSYCRLGPEMIDYITEINPLRVGKYLPGAHIPIVDEEQMFTDPRPADAAVLFAWNYYNETVPKLRARGWNGEVICP